MYSEVVKLDWRDLHDAVVESIVVGWDKFAWVHFNLAPNGAYVKPPRPLRLIGTELKHIECPQRNPWGPSDFVNGVEERKVDGGTRLEIEMQSGDVIVVEATSFEVQEGGEGLVGAVEPYNKRLHLTAR